MGEIIKRGDMMELIAKKFVTYKDLVAWNKNPRSAPDKVRLEELVASIREKGILDPLLCRTGPDGHRVDGGLLEVINGGRRLRAAQELKLDHVPVEIYSLTDQEALEINLAEQIQREDLSLLEEARALARFTGAGAKPDLKALGQKIGKSAGYVRIRLDLLRLTPEAQKIFETNRMPLSVAVNALAIDPEDQKDYLEEVLFYREDNAVMWNDRRRRELGKAAFDLKMRSEKVGGSDTGSPRSCPDCPFRYTGKQPDLFAEIKDFEGDDLCLDPGCFDQRTELHFRTQLEKQGFPKDIPLLIKEGRQEVSSDYRAATKACAKPKASYSVNARAKPELRVVCGDAACKHHKAYDDKEKRRQAENKSLYGGTREDPKKKEERRRQNRAEFLLKAQAFVKACTPQIIRAQALSCVADCMSDDADIHSEPIHEAFGKKALSYPRTYHPWLQFAKDAKTFEESLQKLVLLAAVKAEDDDYFQTEFMDEVLGKKARIDPKAIAAKVKELYPEPDKKAVSLKAEGGGKQDPVQREINRAFALLELNCSDSIFRKIRAKTKDANPGALADYLQAAVEAEKKQAKKGGRTWKELEVQVGTCRVCGCTEDAACPGGCSWADKTKTLCSRCAKKPAKSISRKTATKK